MTNDLILPGSEEYRQFRKSSKGQEILGNYTLAHRVADMASAVSEYVAPVARKGVLLVAGGAAAVGLSGCPGQASGQEPAPGAEAPAEAPAEPDKDEEEGWGPFSAYKRAIADAKKKKAEAEAKSKAEAEAKAKKAEAAKDKRKADRELLGRIAEGVGKVAEEQEKTKETVAGLAEKVAGVEKEFRETVKDKAEEVARKTADRVAKNSAEKHVKDHAKSLLHREANAEMVQAYETLDAVLDKYESGMTYYDTDNGIIYFNREKADQKRRVLVKKKGDVYTLTEQALEKKSKPAKKMFKKGEKLPDGSIADKDKEAEINVEYTDWDKKSEYSFDIKTGTSKYHIVTSALEGGVWKEKSTDYDTNLLASDVKKVLRAIAELQTRNEEWERPIPMTEAERVGYSSFEFSGSGYNEESGHLQPLDSRKNHVTLKGHGTMKTSAEEEGTKEGGGGLISIDLGNVLEAVALYNYFDMQMPNGESVYSNEAEALAALTGHWFRLSFGGKYENTIRRSMETDSETITQGADSLTVDTAIDNWSRREGRMFAPGIDIKLGEFLLGGRFIDSAMNTISIANVLAKIYGTVNGQSVDDFENIDVETRLKEVDRAALVHLGVDAKNFLLLPFLGYRTKDVSREVRTRTESGETIELTDDPLLNEYAVGAKIKFGIAPLKGSDAVLSTIIANIYTNTLVNGKPGHGVGGNLAVSDLISLIPGAAKGGYTNNMMLGFDLGYNDGNADVGVLLGINPKGINAATRKQLAHYLDQKVGFRTVPWGMPEELRKELSMQNFVNAAEAGNVALVEYLFKMQNGNQYHGGRIAIPIGIGDLGSESGRNHKVVIYADVMYGLNDYAAQATFGAATTLKGATIFAEGGFEKGVNGLGPNTQSLTARAGLSIPFGAKPRER